MSDKKNIEKFKLEYTEGNTALLLGNGINNLENKFRWDLLLKRIDSSVNLEEKPYPLAFEEIVLNKLLKQRNNKTYTVILKEIKDQISEHCNTIIPQKYHLKLEQINVDTFLTTNYDYAIEKTLNPKFDIRNVERKIKDVKYSLNRFHNVGGNKVVWHIHGEIDNGYKKDNPVKYASASIMIGHEHYGDYYRRIHQYLRPFSTDEKTLQKIINNPSWINLFFTHNLHIVGFSLDSSEFHLWWLLAYRARIKEYYGNIENNIYFHCASYDLESKKQKAKIDLLKSFGVIVKQKKIKTNTSNKYIEYWDDFFSDINVVISENIIKSGTIYKV